MMLYSSRFTFLKRKSTAVKLKACSKFIVVYLNTILISCFSLTSIALKFSKKLFTYINFVLPLLDLYGLLDL